MAALAPNVSDFVTAASNASSVAAGALEVADLRKFYRSPEGERRLVVDVEAFSVSAGAQIAVARRKRQRQDRRFST